MNVLFVVVACTVLATLIKGMQMLYRRRCALESSDTAMPADGSCAIGSHFRTSALLVVCTALLLVYVPRGYRLYTRIRKRRQQEAAACEMSDRLAQLPPPPERVPANATREVRLYWWYRWGGQRRSARRPEAYQCAGPDAFRCVSDSRPQAFARADGVIVWSGPGHRRGLCLPPQRAAHTWVLEFSEPPELCTAGPTIELYDEAFKSRFEVKVSHELDSDVPLTALHPLVEGGRTPQPRRPLTRAPSATHCSLCAPRCACVRACVRAAGIPPKRWHRRPEGGAPARRAIVFLASPKGATGCTTPNRRDELVRQLQASLPPSLPLHAIGRCLHNFDEPLLIEKQTDGGGNASTWRSKVAALSQYAFCLVAENSVAHDYVTEKLFHAFAAGCLPIYYGTEDVWRHLPVPQAALQVLSYPSVADLVSHLATLASNATAFRAHVAWRNDATLVRAWWARMQAVTHAAETATKPALFCAICRAVRRRRAKPRHQRRALRASPRPRESVWPPLLK